MATQADDDDDFLDDIDWAAIDAQTAGVRPHVLCSRVMLPVQDVANIENE